MMLSDDARETTFTEAMYNLANGVVPGPPRMPNVEGLLVENAGTTAYMVRRLSETVRPGGK